LTVRARNIADFVYIGSRSLLVFPTFTDCRVAAYTAPLTAFKSI